MKAYGSVVLIMAACTALSTLILPLLSVTDVAMLYLLVVGLVASQFGRGPSIAAAFLSIGLFDFFFVPPWSFDLWQVAGVGTANFPDAPLLFLPLVGATGRLGVLAVRPDDLSEFREPVVRQVLETFAAQAAVAVEHVRAMRAEEAVSSTSG